MVEVLLSGCVTAKKLKEGMYYHFVVTISCIKEGFLILTDGQNCMYYCNQCFLYKGDIYIGKKNHHTGIFGGK